MKKVLMLASVASMIGQFNIPNIEILQEMGYQVDVACNFKSGSTCADETIAEWKRKLQKMGVRCYQVDISRSVTDVVSNTKALWQVEYLLDKNQYEFIHCHSPIGSVVARIAGKIKHTKVIYTAHGFHFFKGAPKKNWMIYYPVEKFLSRWTDTIITINHEDYERAKSKFHAKRVEYIPGVGIDLDKFSSSLFTKEECGDVRKELGIPEDAIWLLSVGELNVNKNHETVIRALDGLREKEPETFANLYYTVAGEGDRRDELQSLIETLGLSAQVKLLGYRNDVSLLCESADIFVMPSFREGLPVSLMEAMASGLPCVASRIRGNTDLLDEKGGMLFDPHSVDECWKAIGQVIHSNIEEAGCHNRNKIKHFGKAVVEKAIAETYGNVEKDNGNSGGGYLHLEGIIKTIKKREELGVPQDSFLLLSTGELNENKNHTVIIKAMRRLLDRDYNLYYMIAGIGGKMRKLQDEINESGMHGRIRLLGYRSDVEELCSAADLFCFPSHREGLGLAALEAMASGLPLVTSNVHGINDYSIDGVSGYKCDPDDADGFAEAIGRLIDNPKDCRRFGEYNRKQVQKYGLEKVGATMQRIYIQSAENCRKSS